MNWRKVALAAGAGAAGAAVIFVGLSLAAAIALYGWVPLPGGDSSTNVFQLLLFLVIPPPILSLGGAIPTRALGVRWRQALLISFFSHLAAIFALAVSIAAQPFDDLRTYAVIFFVPAAVLVTLAANHYGTSSTGTWRLLGVLVVAALLIFSLVFVFPQPIISFVMGTVAWILLPAIAAYLSGRSSPPVATMQE